jgi:uncharacterized cupredoxin-like copper-binding protein
VWRLIASALVACSVVAGHAGAASQRSSTAPQAGSSLTALVAEWSVVPSTAVVAAGNVRLRVRNVGNQEHEIVVARTARFADTLPLRGARAAARTVSPGLIVEPGETRVIDLELRQGSYLLLDNLPWHYWAGASVPFRVR